MYGVFDSFTDYPYGLPICCMPKIVIKKKIIIKKCLQKRKVMFSDDVLAAFDVVFAEAPKLNYRRIKTSEARFLCTLGPFPTPRFARSFFIFAVHFAAVLVLSMTCFALV